MIPLRDRNKPGTFPFITLALIIVNAMVFLFELSLNEQEVARLFYRYGVLPHHAWLALQGHVEYLMPFGVSAFTSMFLHGGWAHIIGNMWYLWIFGDNVEDRFGHVTFLVFYLACGVVAAATHTLFELHSEMPTVGASGAIAGVLGAYLVSFPRARILTLVPIFFFLQLIELPAVILLVIWFLLQWTSVLTRSDSSITNVAFMAHIGGFITGMVLVSLIRARRGFRQRDG